jgi:uncharacterized membrane protein YeaQ/YmgE (transglycosylase-associated protein family)
MVLWIIGWIVAGAAIGFLGNLLAHKRGKALVPDLVLGVLGAVVGGWIFAASADFGLRGLGVAALAAGLILFISHGPDAFQGKPMNSSAGA